MLYRSVPSSDLKSSPCQRAGVSRHIRKICSVMKKDEAAGTLCGGPHGLVLPQHGAVHLVLQHRLHPQAGAAATLH